MDLNWFQIGSTIGLMLLTIIFSVVLSLKTFERYLYPPIIEQLEAANKTVKQVASFAGKKGQEYSQAKTLEKDIAADVLNQAIPELQALKLILSPETWEKIEDTINENPEQILILVQKYGHLLGLQGETKKQPEFMF